MSDVLKFLRKHENRSGEVGEFIRSCILVAEVSEILTRNKLRTSSQMNLLLDCFPCMEDEDEDDVEVPE